MIDTYGNDALTKEKKDRGVNHILLLLNFKSIYQEEEIYFLTKKRLEVDQVI